MSARVVSCLGLLAAFVLITAKAQELTSPGLKGLRLYGATEADLPVVRGPGFPLVVEFDVTDTAPPDLEFRFVHCDRNWNVTPTGFVNDEVRLRTFAELPYKAAPQGVRGYSYHYRVVLPDPRLFGGFQFSGNYLLQILDRGTGEVRATGRFFVAESLVTPSVRMRDRRDPDTTSPWNEVVQLSVAFQIPAQDSAGMAFVPTDFSTVDIYKNRELTRSWRIDADDRDVNTFVDGIGTTRPVFRIDNIRPGNEYRTMDLRDVDFYPQDRPVRLKGGADVSRFLQKPRPDHDGASMMVKDSRYAEYLEVVFELLWDSPEDSVYVVGDFNGWDPRLGGPFLRTEDRFEWRTSVRRGRYDYQYVAGDDWIALEGNDWRTSNRYTALVYFRDPRFGGVDRIVGSVVGRNRGGAGLRD